MEITDKAASSSHEAFDRSANATNQAAETLGEKDVHLKHTEQQLLKNCHNYVRYNPWVTQ
jgi:ElaB/YqjD/DUF883 family membrane-anchored ribosome-binding protein